MIERADTVPRRRTLSVEDHVEGVLNRDRSIVAQTITLIESNSASHMEKAQEVLKRLLPFTGNSIRVGITGVPGAGKSTFIEAMGTMLCGEGQRVCVLAIDPSSGVTKGSILGDKTRMECLSRNHHAFIRPSAAGGTLGGVGRKSRETMLVCEAAGYDVILIETVGVGQGEVTVRSMVDFFLLLMITGAGDELQGLKKGVIELADALLINKADGENKIRALVEQSEHNRVLRFLNATTEGWLPQAYICSALTREGIREIWSVIEQFRKTAMASGVLHRRRRTQMMDWVHAMIQEYLQSSFFKKPDVIRLLPALEQKLASGMVSATMAVQELINTYENR